MTVAEYIESGAAEQIDVKGFTIGNGKKVYWYITPFPNNNKPYRCLPIEEDGTLGWPRYVVPEQKIKVVYKSR